MGTVAEWVRKSTTVAREVEFADGTLEELGRLVSSTKLQHFKKNESEQVRMAIHETLSVDVRSIYQENRAKQTEATMQFDKLLISFLTMPDKVIITKIERSSASSAAGFSHGDASS